MKRNQLNHLIKIIIIMLLFGGCSKDKALETGEQPEEQVEEPVTLNTSLLKFSPDAPWYDKVQSFEKDEHSALMISSLVNEQLKPYYNGVAAFNYSSYNIPLFIAGDTDPVIDVVFEDPSKDYIPDNIYKGKAHFKNVKIPSNIKPPNGLDSSVSIWDPKTDTLWEFWKFRKKDDGKYYATWGGRIDNVSKHIGVFDYPYGQTATGISSSALTVKAHELLEGLKMIKNGKKPTAIKHAISLAILQPRIFKEFSWPANRSDGLKESTGDKYIREGQRIRLSKDVDVMSLAITDIAKVIAVAVQEYGFILQDKAGSIAITAEGAEYYQDKDNPWNEILTDKSGNTIPSYAILKNFPWDKCEVVKADAGKK